MYRTDCSAGNENTTRLDRTTEPSRTSEHGERKRNWKGECVVAVLGYPEHLLAFK